MKAVGKIALVAVAAAVVVPGLAAEFHSFGRAGGVVGVERVERIASNVSPQDLREFDAGYGRAGGPAASAAGRPATPDRKVDVAVVWFGRGAPLPVGG